ncbi:histidine phosphatase family protein [Deinococcus sp. LM3]|uniref:histidine phosphatase family protein n=1 Tax=Deinococcus sp. LM3 TaxID=1938608 RepID=UPI001F0B413C|nr:histidine phosphatase family protein [Deinococcus sp. LM3]
MPDALTLHLVRHAPTLPNAQRRYPHPHEDAPLTPAGEALARRLDLPRSALAFTSPLGRARQTARLAGFPHAAPTPALAEASFGVMAGHTWAELEATHGDAPRAWIEALSDPASPHGPPAATPARASTPACRRGWIPSQRVREWPSRTPDRCWPRCASR